VAHINSDELNDYFISICECAAVAAQYDIENAAAGSGYKFDAVHVVNVLYAMDGIKNKAVGDDGISIEFLKMIFEFVAEPITHLVNLVIDQRKFVNSCKQIIVVPIPKKNVVLVFSRSSANQSLILLSNIVKKVIFREYTMYLNSCEFFDQKQSWFRGITALLEITEDVGYVAEVGMMTILLLLNFSKAFDSVRHDLLLLKIAVAKLPN
jgi:hypothetical protein